MRTAAYARYSSDQQREASLEDQLRNCRTFCDRQGWSAPVAFTDAAMSGARNDRPGYLRLLAAARDFDVIVVDDLTRLARDSVEAQQQVRRLKFAGVRVIAISDGIDTATKGHKLGVGLKGLMGELYLDDLAEKTHRGQTGRALAGASAGGLPFGYVVTGTGERAIEPEKADVVRRIFAAYIAGKSARVIAAELNAERVPSPRGRSWAVSAIFGDQRRGIGILANPIYAGRQVWNRSHFTKHPDTGRRVRQERPESEWIVRELPHLAIVDASTWEAAQVRARGGSRPTGGGETSPRGRPAKHLLSGLLRCAACGGPMVVVDAYRYGCGRAKDRGTCSSKLRIPRKDAEEKLLAGILHDLLSAAAFARFQRAASEAIRQGAPNSGAAEQRLRDAERVRGNIMAALRAGIITPSTRSELISAEAEVTAAQGALAAAQAFRPAALLPRAREIWARLVAEITDRVRDLPRARDALRRLVGDSITVLKNDEGAIYAEIAPSKINMVAGACSVLYLTEPVRIVLVPPSSGEL